MSGLELLGRLQQEASRFPVVVVTDHGSAENAAEAIRLGAADFVTKPFDRSRLKVTVANALRQHQLATMVDTLQEKFTRERFHRFVGGSAPMQAVYRIIESAAPSRASVFITGESGTGKELCAEAIHQESPRRAGPFVAVNCAALPRDLIESEIFGHVKGAFTGAVRQRDGAASLADGGTLFLDEIGEMDLDLQAKLLRFVQTGQFQRVGSGEMIKVDVRIVCATNRDPLEQIRQGRFREDLYYRLHVIPIHLPPLRDRGQDVISIARLFLQRFAAEEGKGFERLAPATEQLLRDYPWPGNVRELENVVRNAVVLNDGDALFPQMLPVAVTRRRIATEAVSDAPPLPPVAAPVPGPATGSPRLHEPVTDSTGNVVPLWQVERQAIESAIEHFGGNVLRAAAALEISPSTIYRKRQAWESQAKVG
jgi:DNA-binding NtrC family response regulator